MKDLDLVADEVDLVFLPNVMECEPVLTIWYEESNLSPV